MVEVSITDIVQISPFSIYLVVIDWTLVSKMKMGVG